MATNSKKTETLVGLFLFIGFSLLAGIILLFGNIGDFFKERYQVKVNFTEASGVIEGSTVRLRGAKIGQVAAKPLLTGDSMIQVVLDVENGFQIDQGSTFQIGQASLLGDKEVVITPPVQSSHVYLNPGAEVMGSDPGGLELLQNEAGVIAGNTQDLLKDAKGTLAKLEVSMDEIRTVVTKMGMTMDKVNDGLLTEQNLDSFSRTLSNLNEASASFAKLGMKLDPTLDEFRLAITEVRATSQSAQVTIESTKGAIETAKETLETATEAMETAKVSIAKIDPALEKVPRVLDSIEKTADRATAAIDKVDSKKGALGALVSDQELKTDMKDFVRNLKKNGVLRYKDEDEKEEDPRDRYQGRRR